MRKDVKLTTLQGGDQELLADPTVELEVRRQEIKLPQPRFAAAVPERNAGERVASLDDVHPFLVDLI